MGDNYFADWTSQADEERKHRAWAALATSSDEGPHRSMANQVQLPEMSIVADPQQPAAAPSYDHTPPEPDITPGTDAQASPDMPPDAPPLARLGASLRQRDSIGDAPTAPARSESTDSSGDGKTNWTGTALAALADILLNHGRGVGGVLALGAAGQSPMAKAELDLKRAQAEHLRNPTSDPAAMAYKQAQLDLQRAQEERRGRQGDAGIELRRENTDNTQNRFATRREDLGNPDSQFNRTKVLVAGQTAGASAQGRIGAEHDLNDVVTGDKAQIAGAESAARIGAGHDLAPITTADEANKARAVGYAGNEPKLAYEQSMNPILNDRGGYGVGAGLTAEHFAQDNPGLHINDPDQLDRAMKTRAINAKTLEQIQSARGAGSIIQRLHDTAEEIQRTNPFSDRAATLRRQYKVHTAEYASIMMGMTNKSEGSREEYESQVPDPNVNPKALAGVEGLWGGLEQNIDRNLGALGIGADKPKFLMDRESAAKGGALGQPTDAQGTPGTKAIDTTNPTPSASPAKGDYANYSRDTSDPLPTTKGKPPPIPGAEQRTRHVVHTPNGDEAGDLTQDEVLAFRRKGLRVD